MSQLAPPDVMRGALRVLYVAAYTTRNWTLNEKVSRKQINDLWEAIHEIPSVLAHWRSTEEFEHALQVYLSGYIKEWKAPDLLAIYKQAKNDPGS
jgi:hypothetical protein